MNFGYSKNFSLDSHIRPNKRIFLFVCGMRKSHRLSYHVGVGVSVYCLVM